LETEGGDPAFGVGRSELFLANDFTVLGTIQEARETTRTSQHA